MWYMLIEQSEDGMIESVLSFFDPKRYKQSDVEELVGTLVAGNYSAKYIGVTKAEFTPEHAERFNDRLGAFSDMPGFITEIFNMGVKAGIVVAKHAKIPLK